MGKKLSKWQKYKTNNIHGWLGLLFTVAMIPFVGCNHSSQPSPPSAELIRQDLDQLAKTTNAELATSTLAEYNNRIKNGVFEVTDFKIQGTSREGMLATIAVDVKIKFIGKVQATRSFQDPSGFTNWFMQKPNFNPQEERLLAVKLTYRNYDTGWRLEKYN